jgi:hypothetical protein
MDEPFRLPTIIPMPVKQVVFADVVLHFSSETACTEDDAMVRQFSKLETYRLPNSACSNGIRGSIHPHGIQCAKCFTKLGHRVHLVLDLGLYCQHAL